MEHMFECYEYTYARQHYNNQPRECLCPDSMKKDIKKRIFIFGTSGLLGTNLVKLMKDDFTIDGIYNQRKGIGHKVDVTDFDEVEKHLHYFQPDVVINTIALNNVDYCENHREEAKRINVDFVEKLCKTPYKIIHLSSDLVFDGNCARSYFEEDETNPINYYGLTKRESEKIVLKNENNLVVRASVLYGWLSNDQESSSKKESNFGKWLVNELKNNRKVKVVYDEYSTPIMAYDLARSIVYLIKTQASRLYHSAPPLNMSRYDFALNIAKTFGFNSKLIEAVTTGQLGRGVHCSLNKCLNSIKLQSEGFGFFTLDESLKMFKEDMIRNER